MGALKKYLFSKWAVDKISLGTTGLYDYTGSRYQKQMNPLQTLPIFKDKELVLTDSHAINTYLASRYCGSDQLLPRDAGGRAVVDQLLFYNCGVLQPRYRSAADPIMYENCRFVLPDQIYEIENAYADLEMILTSRPWLTGSCLTLADISIASTISTLNILVPVDKAKYPNLTIWLFKMSEECFYSTANIKGLDEFAKRIDSGEYYSNEFKACPRSSLARRSQGVIPPEENIDTK